MNVSNIFIPTVSLLVGPLGLICGFNLEIFSSNCYVLFSNPQLPKETVAQLALGCTSQNFHFFCVVDMVNQDLHTIFEFLKFQCLHSDSFRFVWVCEEMASNPSMMTIDRNWSGT